MSAGKWIALVVSAIILQGALGTFLDARASVKKGWHVSWDDAIVIGFLGAILVTGLEAIIVAAIIFW